MLQGFFFLQSPCSRQTFNGEGSCLMSNSNSLSVIGSNSLAENEKTLTTKELAQVLGVDKTTITKTVNRLEKGGDVLHHLTGDEYKNTTWVFTEEQATIIKQEIQKHHNLATRQIDTVSTEYEENQMIANAMMILQKRNAELKARMEVAENALNRISDGKGCYGMNQTAKALKLPYGDKTLYRELVRMEILNEDHSPRQEQINAGRFKVVVKFINDYVGSKPVTLTTGKGLVYLAKKFNTTIDESVLPDAK